MSERRVKVAEGARPILIPHDSSISKDPIEGGVAVMNASIPPNEDGHITYRTVGQSERAESVVLSGWSKKRSMAFLRMDRNQRLKDSDWVELPSAQARLTPEQKTQWEEYRENLRHLPEIVDPDDFEWPTPPG